MSGHPLFIDLIAPDCWSSQLDANVCGSRASMHRVSKDVPNGCLNPQRRPINLLAPRKKVPWTMRRAPVHIVGIEAWPSGHCLDHIACAQRSAYFCEAD